MYAPRLPLLTVYARNVEHHVFKRGWTAAQLARKLGVSLHTVNRVRFSRGRYLDPELFEALLDVFHCEPNDLLLPQDGLDYPSLDPDPDTSTVRTSPRRQR